MGVWGLLPIEPVLLLLPFILAVFMGPEDDSSILPEPPRLVLFGCVWMVGWKLGGL